jgi:hypothetical protein
MDFIQSMSQDEALVVVENLTDVAATEIGRHTVFSGKNKDGLMLHIVLPLAGDALIVTFDSQLLPDY